IEEQSGKWEPPLAESSSTQNTSMANQKSAIPDMSSQCRIGISTEVLNTGNDMEAVRSIKCTPLENYSLTATHEIIDSVQSIQETNSAKLDMSEDYSEDVEPTEQTQYTLRRLY